MPNSMEGRVRKNAFEGHGAQVFYVDERVTGLSQPGSRKTSVEIREEEIG